MIDDFFLQFFNYKEELSLENFLIISIIIFLLLSIIIILLTLIKRAIKINRIKKNTLLQESINKLLFELIYEDITVIEAVKKFKQNPLFKRKEQLFIKTIIELHKNFLGKAKKNLEDFYFLSEISKYSTRKLKSNNIVKVIEALRELSVLDVHCCNNEIIKIANSKNYFLAKEAVIALFTLKGLDALPLIPQNFRIDNWTQSRIIYNIKNKQNLNFQHLELLLQSNNETFKIFYARIVIHFQIRSHYHKVLSLNQEIKNEIQLKEINILQQRIIS